jgi:hypothetical protein
MEMAMNWKGIETSTFGVAACDTIRTVFENSFPNLNFYFEFELQKFRVMGQKVSSLLFFLVSYQTFVR